MDSVIKSETQPIHEILITLMDYHYGMHEIEYIELDNMTLERLKDEMPFERMGTIFVQYFFRGIPVKVINTGDTLIRLKREEKEFTGAP